MKKIKQAWGKLAAYPLILLFFGFLLVYAATDMLTPDRASSPLENRPLAQPPAFSAEALISNQWTKDYTDYTKDQLLFRDEWISLHSLCETAQGKLENNGIWYAKNDYQIAKNSVFTSSQQQKLPINTTALCELAQRHPGKVSVMIVPSPANTLSSLLRYNPPQINENALLDDIFSQVKAAGATVVDLRRAFAKAENENTGLYYRTDHHWTTTGGAWLAYQDFCATQGLQAVTPNAPLVEIPNFYGTNYAKTKHFGTRPDTLSYYNLPNSLAVFQAQADGSYTEESGPLMQQDKLGTYDKYGAFLRGNNGYSVLQGTGTGSILLIKDSYGNCFAPYIAQNYAKIGIIDLRAWMEVDKTYQNGNYDEILVLYSFNAFSQDMYANRMGTAMQK